MNTQFDIPEVLSFYRQHKNYEIQEINPESDRAFIYFSSNGIYFPNTEKVFEERIVKGNRFDWKRNVPKDVNKAIFIRDVLKSWYIKGINSEIDSIEKLATFLKSEVSGLRVTCVGSSAGGYAATLLGSLIKAERIFNFSGQFSLLTSLKDENFRLEQPLLTKYESSPQISQYYSLNKFIRASQVPIFYFYPAHCPMDSMQFYEIDRIGNVYSFAFDSVAHAKTCLPINFLDLFDMTISELVNLHLKYKNCFINPLWFSTSVSGLKNTFAYKLSSKILGRSFL